jgi:hypothetical protein
VLSKYRSLNRHLQSAFGPLSALNSREFDLSRGRSGASIGILGANGSNGDEIIFDAEVEKRAKTALNESLVV